MAARVISGADRFRLLLGAEREKLAPPSRRAARALDELYGHGRGEGASTAVGGGGGREAPYPSTREWADELEALFGEDVCEEVLGVAAERGRTAALLELDPAAVTPSVELLERVLSLRGGMPEAQLGRLRALIRKIVDALVKELAVRVTPALTGVVTPRPTRRPRGPIDLGRTVRANLDRAAQNDDGSFRITPERLVFRTRQKRAMDWEIVLVVDVSGSMEPSVIYSAMMAAILSAVPWVRVRFLAFSTEVIDLSEHVADPLALLLEVQVGGGTHIARALRHAQSLVRVPSRTLVVVVSDFEEGFPLESLLAEVRSLVESGVTALGLASLDDAGKPRFSAAIAGLVAGAGMPVAALSPVELARWVGERIRAR
ncbi:MAG: VWA domain-containing protein [Sandaracinus sp.]